jgi:low affinity Fe/Cu permease
MQTDVQDVSGINAQKQSLVKRLIDVIKDDIAETIEVVKETEKLSKL